MKVFTETAVTSTDPIEYDELSHHIAFRSVYSGLVSQYKLGEFTPMLAENWSVSSDSKTWRFKLRSGLKFSNGRAITPEVAKRSLMRLALLLQKKGSHSEVFDHLIGIGKIRSPDSSIDGLRVDGDELIFSLTAPVPKFLETISFGIYGIVDDTDFDIRTGVWLNSKKIAASGAYEIEAYNDDSLVLRLRNDYPRELRHPNSANRIEVTWNREAKDSADVIVGLSIDNLSQKGFKFFGGPPSGMAYVHCVSWPDSSRPCSRIESRRAARTAFYSALSHAGVAPALSFFPPNMPGIRQSVDSGASAVPVLGLRFLNRNTENEVFLMFQSVARKFAAPIDGFPRSRIPELRDPTRGKYEVDIVPLYSGVLIEDPRADIRFMFLSKEGIRLPDLDGRITAELQKPDFDPQKINELIWDQAVIWPYAHFSIGLWTSERVDTSLINPLLPPTDLQWLGFAG